MRLNGIYFFIIFYCLTGWLSGQNPSLEQLVNNVLSQKDYEKQQNRHVAINDSLDRLNLFKTEYNYINLMHKACAEKFLMRLDATVLNSKGNFFIGTGSYLNAIEVFNRSAFIFDSLKLQSGLSMVHANIGNVYFYMEDYDKAELFFKQAISDYKNANDKKTKDETKLANLYNSLGSLFATKGDYVYGRTYFDLAYQIWRKHGDSLSMAYIINNYANIYFINKKLDSALFYFNMARDLKLRHGGSHDKADAHNNLSSYYFKNKDYRQAEKMSMKAISYMDTSIFSRQLTTAYSSLTGIYQKLGDYKNELKYYKLLKVASDSNNVQVQQSKAAQAELKHEFDRIHLSDSIKSAEEIKIRDLKISEKKQQSYFLIFIIVLTIVALSLIYSRFKVTKKQKQIIEEKNKEITDSINYARKIQNSIMANESYMDSEIKRLRKRKKGD